MTVGELIEKLKEMPQEHELRFCVCLNDSDYAFSFREDMYSHKRLKLVELRGMNQ